MASLKRGRELYALSPEVSRLLIESVQDYAIFVLDPAGHVATWNPGAEKLKGYRADEVLGKHFSMFFGPDDVRENKPQRELEAARAHGRYEEEGYRVRKDGTRFWASIVLTSIHNEDGTLFGFAKVTHDLTARMEAEKTARDLVREQAARSAAEEAETRVRDSEQRYRDLSRRLGGILEGVLDGITVQDRSGAVIFANSGAARASGFSSVEDLLRATPSQIVERFELCDEQGNVLEPSQLPGRRVMRGEPPCSQVLRFRDRISGHEGFSLVRASAVPGPDEQPELAITIWHDVTEDYRREQHEKYLGRVTAALSGSLDYDTMLATVTSFLVPGLADFCAIHMLEDDELKCEALAHQNPEKVALARELIRRYPPERAAPHGVWKVLASGDAELYEEIPEAMLPQLARDAEHLAILRALGMRSVMIVPIRDREGAFGAISLVSADERRRYDQRDLKLAEELARRAAMALVQVRLYARAQKAAKNAEAAAKHAEAANRVKDEFLATVSHELRTPLSAILGWSAVLRTRAMDTTTEKAVDIIHRNAIAQGKIIEDILDVSRIITGKLTLDLRPTQVLAIVRDAIEVIRPSALAKDIAIDLQSAREDYPLVADPERLQQIMWNLLSNAVKFSDRGDRITVEVHDEGAELALSVRDTGQGIEPDFLPLVFDRFQQADSSTTRRVGGLGLGLAIVRHLVELHGGRVEAKSQGRGQGTTFTVTLPVRGVPPATLSEQENEAEQRKAFSRVSFARVLEGKRVLVVDDEPDARDLVEMVLTRAGARVETASSAQEGLESLRSFRPHVLVSDIGMPNEDGYAFIERVRSIEATRGGRVAALALSAYTREQDKARAVAAGFTRHLGKPVDPVDLVAVIAELSRQVVA